jgi:hypothetical protein
MAILGRRGLVVFATAFGPSAWAQQGATPAPPPRQGPRTLVGIVTDTSGNAIDSADVLIASLRRRTTTSHDGLFKFADLNPGAYSVSVRRVGYYPQTRTVTVDTAGGSTAFSLVPHITGLPPVVTSAARGGLSGVVGDTAYNTLRGAQITVIAGNRRATSDSLGAFYMDLKPGRYAVSISRPGYTPRLVSVTIPPDSGRRVVVWLTPSAPGFHAREAAAMDGLRERLLRRNPVFSKIYTREDVLRTGMTEATQFATLGAVMPVDASCQAIVDGNVLDRTPLWIFKAADIEMLEVYAPRRPSYAPTHMYPGGGVTAARPADVDPCNGVTVWIWLRK